MGRSKSYSTIVICFGVIISALLLLLSGEKDISLHIFSILILALASTISVKMDLYHPLCIYIASFALYSVGYAILYKFDIYTTFGYTKEAMACMWFAILVCILFIPSKRLVIPPTPSKSIVNILCPVARLLTYIFSTISYIGLVYIIHSGFANKLDMYEGGGIIIKLICTIVYFNTLYFTLYFLAELVLKNPIDKKWFIYNFCSIALFGVITGERDYLFHILLIVCISLALTGHIKKKSIPLLAIAGMMLIVLTKSFKYVFLSGESSEIAVNQLFFSFIDGEFSSAGRNMQVLVDQDYRNYFGGESLLIDVFRVFYDFGFSTQQWFNDVVLDYISTGYGFTIVGEGYVNGGVVGIAIVMTISSLILRYIYIRARANFTYLVIFTYMLPQYIYATRADITNILSPLIKRVILGLILLYVISKVLYSSNNIKLSNNDKI